MEEIKANEKLKQIIEVEFGNEKDINNIIEYEKFKIERDKVRLEVGLIYEDIIKLLKSYIDMKEEQYKIIALWIIGTYIHNEFDTYPYLFLNAMRGSAKTRTLRLISHLAYLSKGKVQTGITESVLFRFPKGETLVLDEFENIGSKDKQALREYLNASYKKGGVVSRVKRVKGIFGEDFQIEYFEPYKPIVMANIWGMEEVLGDRCITLILQKSGDKRFIKKIENFDSNTLVNSILARLSAVKCNLCNVVTFWETNNPQKTTYLHFLWNDYIDYTHNNITTYNTLTTLTTQTTPQQNIDKIIEEKETEFSQFEKRVLDINNFEFQKQFEFFKKIDELDINGRNLELCFPLFIISRFLNEELFEEVSQYLKKQMEEKKEEEFETSKDVSLIDFVSQYTNSYFVQVNLLTNEFKKFLQEDETEEKWINSKWMGRALKRLDLILDKKRLSRGIEIRLAIQKAQEKIKIFKKEELK